MLKPNETCLKYKQLNIISERMSQQIKTIFWEICVWSSKTLNPESPAIAFYIFFVINWNRLELKGQWGTIACFNFLKN